VPGVREVISGYTGGSTSAPNYADPGGHFEAVEIDYDPAVIGYSELLYLFFRSINPTDPGGQFCDRGDSYRTAVFVTNTAERTAAEAAKTAAAKVLNRRIVTFVLDAGPFWRAGSEHQDYAKGKRIVITRAGPKSQSEAYKFYRRECGRDARLRDLWGDQAIFSR
jgi:peptide-methionine (S)-S-oxide reductase